MMKRWKWFFMFLIISLAVVGCNDNEEIEEQETENRIVLTVMSSGGSDEILKKIVEEQFPEVSLSFLSYPEEEFYTVMKMKLATGNGADFISVQPGYAGSNELYSLAAGGYLASLPENCTEVLGLDPQAKNLMKVDDRVYGISNISLMLGVLYNKRIFDEEGIKVPACWEEFLDCCETLAKKKIQPIIFGGKDKREIQYGIYQIAVNRLYASKPDFDQRLRERKASFSDPNTWDHVLKTYFQLFEKGYIQESCNYLRTSEALEGFQRGEAAMLISNSMHAIPFLMSEELRGEYGFFPLPANERGGQQYVCKGSLGGLCVYSGSDYVKLCQQILMAYYQKAPGFLEYDDSFQWAVDQEFWDLPSFPLCNQGWPNEVEIVMEKKVSEYLTHKISSVSEITEAMQRELEK